MKKVTLSFYQQTEGYSVFSIQFSVFNCFIATVSKSTPLFNCIYLLNFYYIYYYIINIYTTYNSYYIYK